MLRDNSDNDGATPRFPTQADYDRQQEREQEEHAESIAQAQEGLPEGESDQDDALPQLAPPLLYQQLDLSEWKLSELARRLGTEVDHYRAFVRTRVENCREWRFAATMMPNSGEGPWQNSSQVRAATTARVCAAHTTRLNNQILSQDPPFAVDAKTPEALAAVPQLEEALPSILEEAEWRQVARDAHRELPVACPCMVRATWTRRYVKRPKTVVETDDLAHRQLLEAGETPTNALLKSAVQDDQGNIKTRFEFEIALDRNGVDLKVIPFEDVLVLPASARYDRDLWGLGERVYIRGMDLETGVRDQKYRRDAVDFLLARPGDGFDTERRDRFDMEGLDTAASETGGEDRHYRAYECYELCLLDDLDGDGFLEWYIVTYSHESRKVLGVQYSPYWHGKPYYVLFPFNPWTGEIYGQSTAELIATSQDASSAMMCAFVDLIEFAVASQGAGFYDSQAGFDPDRFELRPGAWIEVQNVDGIKPFGIPPELSGVLDMILKFLQYDKDQVDLLTASSNPALGKETDTSKTLGEVQLVLGQAMQQFEDMASGIAMRWAQVWDLVRWLTAQFADGGEVRYRKTARPSPLQIAGGEAQAPAPAPGDPAARFGAVPIDVLTAEVDLVPAGLNAFADQQARLQRDMMLLNLAAQHPLTATDPVIQGKLLEQTFADARWPNMPEMQQLLDKTVQAAVAQQQFAQQEQLLQSAVAQEQAQQAQQAGAQQQQMQQAQGSAQLLQQLQQAGILQIPGQGAPAGGGARDQHLANGGPHPVPGAQPPQPLPVVGPNGGVVNPQR